MRFCIRLDKRVENSLKLLDIFKKIETLLENLSPLLVSQAGYGPAKTYLQWSMVYCFIWLNQQAEASTQSNKHQSNWCKVMRNISENHNQFHSSHTSHSDNNYVRKGTVGNGGQTNNSSNK